MGQLKVGKGNTGGGMCGPAFFTKQILLILTLPSISWETLYSRKSNCVHSFQFDNRSDCYNCITSVMHVIELSKHLKLEVFLHLLKNLHQGKVKVKSLSHVWLFATPWTVTYQAHQATVHGVFQARILKWVAISFSRGSSWPRGIPNISRIKTIALITKSWVL